MKIFSCLTLTPFRSSLASAALLGIFLSFCSVMLALAPYLVYDIEHDAASANMHGGFAWDLYGSAVVAPILETIVIAVFYQTIVRWMSSSTWHFVFAVMCFAAITHYDRGYGAILAILAFAFFAFQYAAFVARYGLGPAMIGVVVTHSINNATVKLLMALAEK